MELTTPVRALRAREICIHCGNIVPNTSSAATPSRFCCSGCEFVYELLQLRGLGRYYDLKAKSRSLRKAQPVSEGDETFTYLDDPSVQALYAREGAPGSGERSMDFFLEGVHCAACVWLTEQVPDFVKNVKGLRLNLGTSVATVRVGAQGSFAEVAREFLNLGYRPHPVRQGEAAELRQRESRDLLIRLGIAGGCAGNIMLLAVSVYAGATGAMARAFSWISLGLFLPVIFHSAVPFYRSAWQSLRKRQASIDLPVVFGIGLGAIVSVINLVSGDHERIYFDSLSALVFLLLCTRYLLRRVQQSALGSSHLMHFLTIAQARLWSPERQRFVEVSVNRVKKGDRVQVMAGESIPVDGVLLSGQSSVNGSLLTGESAPEPLLLPGTAVLAGTVNLDAPIEIEVTGSGTNTRLSAILQAMEEAASRRPSIEKFTDRISKYFVAGVLVLTGAAFALGAQVTWQEGMNRALAVAIVACPCVFALITPLAFSLTLGRLAKAGILIKASEVIEKIDQAREIFLDKTGTLTFGTPRVLSWHAEAGFDADAKAAIVALESRSRHPVAKALVDSLRSETAGLPVPEVREFFEKIGTGVSGRVNGHLYQAARSGSGSGIWVMRDNRVLATAFLGDELREDSAEEIRALKSLGLTSWILSGDTRSAVDQAAEPLGIARENRLPEHDPEAKFRILSAHPGSIMVGDGANDSIALAAASVGIAVQGGVELSMKAADVYLTTSGIRRIHSLVVLSRETLRVVRRNLALSLGYNIAAATAALLGRIDPLFAAVIMPVTAFTVLLSTLAGTSAMRRSFREILS